MLGRLGGVRDLIESGVTQKELSRGPAGLRTHLPAKQQCASLVISRPSHITPTLSYMVFGQAWDHPSHSYQSKWGPDCHPPSSRGRRGSFCSPSFYRDTHLFPVPCGPKDRLLLSPLQGPTYCSASGVPGPERGSRPNEKKSDFLGIRCPSPMEDAEGAENFSKAVILYLENPPQTTQVLLSPGMYAHLPCKEELTSALSTGDAQ